MRLQGLVVVITGAARGIGRACALKAAEEGADLVITDIDGYIDGVPYQLGRTCQLAETALRCRDKGVSVLALEADVRSLEDVQRVVDSALSRFGKIDALVNNAGIGSPAGMPVHDYSEEQWQLMLDVNLSGPWRMIASVIPTMLKRNSGSIVNISSTAGLVGYKYFSAYVASKHGLIGLSKSAALDYAPANIRVNCICPGPVNDNPVFDGYMTRVVAGALGINYEEQVSVDLNSVPMTSVVDPADVASAMVWLISHESKHMTGSVMTIDAGYTAR